MNNQVTNKQNPMQSFMICPYDIRDNNTDLIEFVCRHVERQLFLFPGH